MLLQERKRTLKSIAVMCHQMVLDWLPRLEVRGKISMGGVHLEVLADIFKMAMCESGQQKQYTERATARSTSPGSWRL
jgi:hypothetical protein